MLTSVDPFVGRFDSLLQQNIDATKLYVLVVGENVPETGKSWCPDCVKADPLIQKALSNDPEVTLLECPVPRSTYKGNPNHPYRTHKQIQLQGVPTLIRWTKVRDS
jgi:hypothetical protein